MKLAMVLCVMHRLSVSNRTINHGSANAIRAGRVMDRLAQVSRANGRINIIKQRDCLIQPLP